ncbi:hypothetical protein QBC46DRAFT_451702 [Diplogelasinospora grovesii]|uniref:Uncharacterized protein n=1 Tax=Diplogelasinospora grovesii TaxID=303347 RepID=A0AAN6S267_9PEZI|nr:hypothetical protein QBC46DRAFT_451702 [Diplogelasinospora grovesii]
MTHEFGDRADEAEDHATTNLGSIYRSLLWQLLRQKPDLKFLFYQWQKTKTPSQVEPTRSNVKLQPAFPSGITKVEMHTSKDRDRAVASYLVKETSVPKVFHEKVVDELAAQAEGSAIWLRMALRYLRKTHISSPEGLGKALKRLPSSYSGLAELYLDLLEKTCEKEWENEMRLQPALETLATACRPLTLHELAYAVILNTEEGSNIATVSELDREAISSVGRRSGRIQGHNDSPESGRWSSTDACSNVASNVSDVLAELRPKPSDLIALCRPNSQRLNNWVYQWCRPNCTKSPECEFSVPEVDLDPLVVTAMFGPAASLADLLLDSHFQPPDFLRNSVWTALKELTKRGEVSSIMNFLEDTKIGPILHDTAFFYEVVPGWCDSPRLRVKDAVEWEAVFDFLIQKLRERLLEDGNEILCLTARNGCLILIIRLFEAGKTDPDLRAAILADKRKRKPGSLAFHPSIGEAIWGGYTEVVHFLCQQHGTENHLRYINHVGRNVFHQWAMRPDTQVFRILIQHWPEGVHLKDVANDTPLDVFIFDCLDTSEDEIIERLQMLLSMGNVDASGKEVRPWHTPLRAAARQAQAKVCRFLITDGSADIYSLLGVDQVTRKPFLIEQLSSPDNRKASDEAKMLKELCSLLPLAVSTEYLS